MYRLILLPFSTIFHLSYVEFLDFVSFFCVVKKLYSFSKINEILNKNALTLLKLL